MFFTSFTSFTSFSKTPSLFWCLLAAFVGLALVPTLWTSLDFNAAAWARSTNAVHWWWVELINLYIPMVFRVMVILSLLTWGVLSAMKKAQKWGLVLAFVGIAGTVGPGVVVNMVFKENWHRARPYQVQEFGGEQHFTRATVIADQCYNNCSFVSGHTACGFFLASLLLIERNRRRRWLWAAAGVGLGALIGFARMADSAHWLSDVLWAAPITWLSSWVVWRVLLRWYPPTAK
ncbi:MAG: hypothetical protein RIR79_1365 [Pseudomonadota bacterium]|jgi:lipid A 4'-phosphatase